MKPVILTISGRIVTLSMCSKDCFGEVLVHILISHIFMYLSSVFHKIISACMCLKVEIHVCRQIVLTRCVLLSNVHVVSFPTYRKGNAVHLANLVRRSNFICQLYLRNKTSVPVFYRRIKYRHEFGYV